MQNKQHSFGGTSSSLNPHIFCSIHTYTYIYRYIIFSLIIINPNNIIRLFQSTNNLFVSGHTMNNTPAQSLLLQIFRRWIFFCIFVCIAKKSGVRSRQQPIYCVYTQHTINTEIHGIYSINEISGTRARAHITNRYIQHIHKKMLCS